MTGPFSTTQGVDRTLTFPRFVPILYITHAPYRSPFRVTYIKGAFFCAQTEMRREPVRCPQLHQAVDLVS